jgi:hypothetical protein
MDESASTTELNRVKYELVSKILHFFSNNSTAGIKDKCPHFVEQSSQTTTSDSLKYLSSNHN